MAQRATRHCGRAGYAKHNDRNFDTARADHIDEERMAQNSYWHIYQRTDPKLTFEEAEKRFYAERYGDALEAQNRRYAASRHRERIRTVDDLYRGKQTQPVETIFQIGNREDGGVDRQTLVDAYNEYVRKINAWNRAHGNHYHRLSIALHVDETTPHVHERGVWDIMTPEGHKIAQDKALEAAGVPLPDPTKPRGRHNNRKMTLDALFREFWLDACQEHGIDVEREPAPARRHLGKEAFIDAQVAAKESRLQALDETLQEALRELGRLQEERRALEARKANLAQETREYEERAQDAYGRLADVLRDAEDVRSHAILVNLLREEYPTIWRQIEADLEDRTVVVDRLSSDPSPELGRLQKEMSYAEIWDAPPDLGEIYLNPSRGYDYDR